ncbi:5'-methylthioadenosine/S-adenosylhomocysteine nucleosidase family protein [Chitinophaga rhizophila]|uniref:5'-methylthioadenosine/S-adenosylhomocysteine nucleosidase n=1 Tax=Chitinophaga rhizophila TaxID=2866212 RepID=A0ABS7G7E8_9BACT|nr:5'-methylthioadenosine/S-adenosylhomocysteine nucleosidase [Chitinophaga rhizophila]MBW8683569.1 5'-methylthioadenosine/S-adenosylhomocysteine nucleosidase [Chitinophaga rhizophila]
MININTAHSYALADVLFTFALDSEAADVFEGNNTVITGIGKVNAAYELTKAIQDKRPSLIVNLGSAGSSFFKKGDVICCTKFVQRDMDVRGLGYAQYETPLSGLPTILEYGLEMDGLQTGICGTGDSFEMGYASSIYNVVDMEAYALAMIAMKENIPFLCLKYISDGADDNAAEDWTVQVHKAAVAYGNLLKLNKNMLA